MNKEEDLMLYKVYLDYMLYIYLLIENYPTKEYLSVDIKKQVNNGINYILKYTKEYNKREKLRILNKLDVCLKTTKVYIRLSYKLKYINKKKYESYSRKLTIVCNIMKGLMKSCKV